MLISLRCFIPPHFRLLIIHFSHLHFRIRNLIIILPYYYLKSSFNHLFHLATSLIIPLPPSFSHHHHHRHFLPTNYHFYLLYISFSQNTHINLASLNSLHTTQTVQLPSQFNFEAFNLNHLRLISFAIDCLLHKSNQLNPQESSFNSILNEHQYDQVFYSHYLSSFFNPPHFIIYLDSKKYRLLITIALLHHHLLNFLY